MLEQAQSALEEYLAKVDVRLADAQFGCDWDVRFGDLLFKRVARRLGRGLRFGFLTHEEMTLDLFILIGETLPPEVSAVTAFRERCHQYVKRANRIPVPQQSYPGILTGFSAPVLFVPVALVWQVDSALSAAIRGRFPRRWSAMEAPILCDLASSTLYYRDKRPLIGRAAYVFTQETILPLLAP